MFKIEYDRIYTTKEAAEYLQIHRSQVCRLCQKYNVQKIGKTYQLTGRILDALSQRESQYYKPKDYLNNCVL